MKHDNSLNTQTLQPSYTFIVPNEPEHLSSNECVERFEQFIIWRKEDINSYKVVGYIGSPKTYSSIGAVECIRR